MDKKQQEDSVMLSREEYKKLKYTWITDSDAYKKGCKETAEKILKDLIKNCQYTFGINGKPIIALDGDFALNVAKQFGVEIKELQMSTKNKRITKKGFRYEILPSTENSPRRVKDYNEYCTLYNRLAELEDKIENGVLKEYASLQCVQKKWTRGLFV